MKRLILFILSLVIMLYPVALAAPQTIDLETMSLEELVSLKGRVDQAIADAGQEAKQVTVPQGKYIIGSDIPAGTYTLTLVPGGLMSLLTIYKDEYESSLSVMYSVSGTESAGKVPFSIGECVVINGSSVVFSPYEGLGF